MKVLYINPGTKDFSNKYFHVGLGYLAAITKKLGHSVCVFDQPFLNSQKNDKSINDVLSSFKPDVVGVSLSTYSYPQAKAIIKRLNKKKIPIVVGGPHTSISHDCSREIKVNYILKGEADLTIGSVLKEINTLKKLPTNKIVHCKLPSNLDKEIMFPEYVDFIGFDKSSVYSINTSRGCPMGCSFCAVKLVSSKVWRPRSAKNCIQELKRNVGSSNSTITEIAIVDDSPNINQRRFKQIILKLIDNFPDVQLVIFHLRADFIDEEMVTLLKKANCDSLHIGVEHGDPEVFEMVSKKETHEDIVRASKIIKKSGLKLGLCFIIGLPGDTLEKTKKSIDFAKKVKADSVYWNVAQPFPGTKMYRWFKKYGKFFKAPNHLMSFDRSFIPKKPIVETKEFSQLEREKAYFMAVTETNQISSEGTLSDWLRLFFFSIKHKLLLRTTYLVITKRLSLTSNRSN